MQGQGLSQQTNGIAREPLRLHYLDWLRVIATLGVFLFHALVFSWAEFVISNAGRSMAVTVLIAFFFPWGMPFFILIAGASSWFALRRRTPGQYARERFSRLLVPFIFGSILFTPIQLYLEWSHKIQTGVVQGSFLEFLKALPWGPNPRVFGVVGYHLWFVGFLFCFSLLSLPVFRWLMGHALRLPARRRNHLVWPPEAHRPSVCRRASSTLAGPIPGGRRIVHTRRGLHRVDVPE
jgi:glucan biosynthesis protein C